MRGWRDYYGLNVPLSTLAQFCHDTNRPITLLRNHRQAVGLLHEFTELAGQ